MTSISTQACDITRRGWALIEDCRKRNFGITVNSIPVSDGWARIVFIPSEAADLFSYTRGNVGVPGTLDASDKGKLHCSQVPCSPYTEISKWVAAI